MVFIVPAFALNTIESTEFPVSREQIHAEGNPQAAAVYRAVNDAIEYHKQWIYFSAKEQTKAEIRKYFRVKIDSTQQFNA